ncbi:MAG TPA: hypothetical protein VEJ18_03470 [Planctomycetota bacterium]|nr:hypothetical protein [Planctomycetota bacterium]
MRRLPVLFAVLAGCATAERPSPAAAPSRSDAELEKSLATQVVFDPALLRPGMRAVYALRTTGAPTADRYSWAVVSADPGGLWVENRVPHIGTPMIVKSKFDRAGKVVDVWAGPPGGIPAQLPTRPAESRPASPPTGLRESPDRITVGGQAWAATKVVVPFRYPDGREGVVASWYAPGVPFAASPRHGGLLRRQAGRYVLELVEHADRGAQPELLLPR